MRQHNTSTSNRCQYHEMPPHYAVAYLALLLLDAPSLPSLTHSGADWMFTRLICLMGHTVCPVGEGREEAGTLAAGTASVVWAIRQCGLHNFYFTENAILYGYRRVQVMRIWRIYAQKYGTIFAPQKLFRI